MESQRVRHDWVTFTFTFMSYCRGIILPKYLLEEEQMNYSACPASLWCHETILWTGFYYIPLLKLKAIKIWFLVKKKKKKQGKPFTQVEMEKIAKERGQKPPWETSNSSAYTVIYGNIRKLLIKFHTYCRIGHLRI